MENPNQTTMTVETPYGKYTIQVNSSDHTIDAFIDDIVKPMLIAIGYHHKCVDEALYNGEE